MNKLFIPLIFLSVFFIIPFQSSVHADDSTYTASPSGVSQDDMSGTPFPINPGQPYIQTLGTGLVGTLTGVEIAYSADTTYYGVSLNVDVIECASATYDDHCVSVANDTESGGWNGKRVFTMTPYDFKRCRYYQIAISGTGPWGSMGATYLYGSPYNTYKYGSFSDKSPYDLLFALYGISRSDDTSICPAPVVIIPGVLGSWQKSGSWVIDPVFHTYDNLIETLVDNGYKAGATLFTFPYDWRNSNVDNARSLKNELSNIRSMCQCSKVDIVAHSMGGLVARSYIQSGDYVHDVGKLIFLGTPHEGAPESYLTWEGGEAAHTLLDQLMAVYLTFQGFRNGYVSLFDYVRNRPVASFQEVLPTFDYIKVASTGVTLSYPFGYPRNTFLEDLSSSLPNLISSGVEITNITGSHGTSTVSVIRTAPAPYWINSSLWKDGYPDSFDTASVGDHGLELGPGDGTVPESGSKLAGVDSIDIASDHISLPTEAEDKIFKLLTGQDAVKLVKKSLPSRILFQTVLSPADILVTVPGGGKIGKDPATGAEINEIPGAFYSGSDSGEEFITIPDPSEGSYGIQVQGKGAGGEYTVASSMVTDATSTESATSSVIEPGETQTIHVSVDNDVPVVVPVVTPIEATTTSTTTATTTSTTTATTTSTTTATSTAVTSTTIISTTTVATTTPVVTTTNAATTSIAVTNTVAVNSVYNVPSNRSVRSGGLGGGSIGGGSSSGSRTSSSTALLAHQNADDVIIYFDVPTQQPTKNPEKQSRLVISTPKAPDVSSASSTEMASAYHAVDGIIPRIKSFLKSAWHWLTAKF